MGKVRTFDHLYPKLCSFENLYAAWKKAAKGKRKNPATAAPFRDRVVH